MANSPRRQIGGGLAAAFLSTFFSLTALFLFFPLLIFTLKGRGLSDIVVGLVASAEWLGLAIGTLFVARWVSLLGLRRAFVVSGLLPFVSMLSITLTPWPALWVVLIMIGGVSGAMRWIVAESIVAQMAPAIHRGKILGLFGTMISMTYIIGPALLALIETLGLTPANARWIALAIGFIGLGIATAIPSMPSTDRIQTKSNKEFGLNGIFMAMKSAPVLMVIGAIGGFFEAGSTGILPLFGLAIGLGETKSAMLIASCGLGGVMAMAPVGALADRVPHRRIYIVCSLISAAASMTMSLVAYWPTLTYIIAIVWGACGGALYTLAMVDIGRRGQNIDLVNFTSVLVLSYTMGGTLGPLLGGAALMVDTRWGLPVLMTLAALTGLAALLRPNAPGDIAPP